MCEKKDTRPSFEEVLNKYSNVIGFWAKCYSDKNVHLTYRELFSVGQNYLYEFIDLIHFDWHEKQIKAYISMKVRGEIYRYVEMFIPAGIQIDAGNDDNPAFQPVSDLPNPEDVLFEEIMKDESEKRRRNREHKKRFMKECYDSDAKLTLGEKAAVAEYYYNGLTFKEAAEVMGVTLQRVFQLINGQKGNTRGALEKLNQCIDTKMMSLNLQGV